VITMHFDLYIYLFIYLLIIYYCLIDVKHLFERTTKITCQHYYIFVLTFGRLFVHNDLYRMFFKHIDFH